MFGRLLQNFQQGVLALDAQFLGEQVDFIVGFIGTDEHILPDVADDFDGHVFVLRVHHGNEVRVVVLCDFSAGIADTAGFLLILTQNCRCQKLCQGVFAGTLRAGEQVEMGHTAPAQAAC